MLLYWRKVSRDESKYDRKINIEIIHVFKNEFKRKKIVMESTDE